MDKSIITFSANEQNLQKTGGIGCYASDTVSYIEAQFALGDNWSGYDSIRAVWFNDYKTISTVLDPDGVCIVPHEVLVSRGKVMVNLVGSVLVSDELKDRLTTFPCEALKVSAKAKISGSETAAVTPSQFEQFVSVVISEVEKVTGMTAQAETLPAGSQATAHYENGILYLGIPQGIQGERGETGADGNGIASVVYNADYSLTLIFDNGERFTTPPIRGERGPAGADGRDGTDGADGLTPNLSIGNVETLEPSEDAYVTRRGTDANPIFDFGIPKGDDGTVPDLDLILPTDTASGDIVSITDGQSVVPVKSLKVTLEPIQDLHGYDKPWSAGAGKNKLQITMANWSSAGITTTVSEDGSITLNGTSSDVINAYPNRTINTTALVGNYFKADVIGGVSYAITDSNGSVVLQELGSGSTAVQIQDNGSSTRLRMRIENGRTFSDAKALPRIGNTESDVSTWTPYSNICPISGRTEVVTEVCGVNVWDEEWEAGGINTDGSLATNSYRLRSKNYISIIPNTAYYFASDVSLGYSSWLIMCFYDGDKNFVSFLSPAVNRTFNTPSNARFMKFCTSDAWNGRTYEGGFSINYPSTDTEYHAYEGTSYTTTLGRTIYGGTLEQVSGTLDDGWAKIKMDDLSWGYNSSGAYPYFESSRIVGADKSYGVLACACSIYEAVTNRTGGSWNGEMPYQIAFNSSAGNPYVRVQHPTITSVADFMTMLQDTDAELAYKYVEPTTIQLDPTTIMLLTGDNNLWSDGSVEVTYNADVGLYIDKKLGTSGTRTLSMTRTLAKSETDDTKSDNIQLAED